jgi:transcriptional accessory protein Tex/SPT6
MEFGPVLSEDEALIKKAVRPEEYDKIKELIALAGEDDLGGNYSASKSVGNLEIREYMPVG